MTDRAELNDFDLIKIKSTISEPRIYPYIRSTTGNNNLQKAIQLYEYNIRLCESLYSILHTFEITFRNKLDQVLIAKYGEMWYSNPCLLLFDNREKEQIDSIKIKKIIKDYKLLSYKEIIPNLSLGFWTSLLTKDFYEQSIFAKCISDVFPYSLHSERNTFNVRDKLEKIRRLRNRVFHYEPIWKPSYNTYERYQTIYLLMKWMCPETSNWMNCHDNFPNIYDMVSRHLNLCAYS